MTHPRPMSFTALGKHRGKDNLNQAVIFNKNLFFIKSFVLFCFFFCLGKLNWPLCLSTCVPSRSLASPSQTSRSQMKRHSRLKRHSLRREQRPGRHRWSRLRRRQQDPCSSPRHGTSIESRCSRGPSPGCHRISSGSVSSQSGLGRCRGCSVSGAHYLRILAALMLHFL